MQHTVCRQLSGEIVDLVEETLSPERAAPLLDHAAVCASCSREVARARRLVSVLSAVPPAPRANFGPPPLPRVPAGRVLHLPRARWIAAAAASVAVAAALGTGVLGRVHRSESYLPGAFATVHVERVVDVAESPPPSDEPLLEMTAGVEAAIMTRPTEFR